MTELELPAAAVTLVIGDWSSWCGACGHGADPDEHKHEIVLPGLTGARPSVGCGAVWTHVAAEVDANIRAADRIRQMRPDLVYLPELVDHNKLPFRTGASATAGATGSVTGRPHLPEGANAGKPGPTTEETPPRPTGAPAGPTPTDGPADTDLVWMSVRRRGLDAHRPDGPDHTGCGRALRHGLQLLAGEARVAYSAHLCDRCWPGLHINHHERVARRSL